MELTLASAVSGDSLMGHLAYIVLVASMLMRTLLWLRILVIVAALLGIAYASLILSDPVSTFWETCLVVVNIVQILRTHWRSWRARFTAEEAVFVAQHMSALSKGDARAFLDAGHWVDIADGAVLAWQGQAVTHLSYIAQGTADVLHDDVVVAQYSQGTFVGEMAVTTGAPATADVRARGSCKLWQVDAACLRDLLARADETSRELDAAFARNYRQKLALMNDLVARGLVPG